MKLFSHKNRAVQLGPYPLERLPRLASVNAGTPLPSRPAERETEGPAGAGHAYRQYVDLYDEQRVGEPAPSAPVPDDPSERADNVKAGLYFLDADMVGCTTVEDHVWTGQRADHGFAVVTLIAHTRRVGDDQPGDDWIAGTRQVNADLRAAELSVITASYLRNLGFEATAHTPTATDVDLDRLALAAGLVERRGDRLRAPFLRGGYAISAVTTTMALTPDGPLAKRALLDRLRSTWSPLWFLGWGGTRAGFGRLNGDHRPLHLGRYPMERIKRVDEPTTLIIDDEVERVPVRAGGFPRAAHGDLGPKFQKDVKVFAFKTPSAQAYVRQIRAMVPFQDGSVADEQAAGTPSANADALKAFAHHLGGDMVGVCRVPRYAWYSHRGDGSVIEPSHENAIVILLDQGYETMEGASGDDWISGAQSMRAYMRGAQIAGIMAEHIRSLGFPARSHTNAIPRCCTSRWCSTLA